MKVSQFSITISQKRGQLELHVTIGSYNLAKSQSGPREAAAFYHFDLIKYLSIYKYSFTEVYVSKTDQQIIHAHDNY